MFHMKHFVRCRWKEVYAACAGPNEQKKTGIIPVFLFAALFHVKQ